MRIRFRAFMIAVTNYWPVYHNSYTHSRCLAGTTSPKKAASCRTAVDVARVKMAKWGEIC
jgi:hypothetical protein